MSVSYVIDDNRQLVLTTLAGPVSVADILGYWQTLRADRLFRPELDEFVQITPGSISQLHYADLELISRSDPFCVRSRRAVLTSSDVDYGVVRMYEVIWGGNLRVFRCVEEIKQFLGRPL